MNKALRDMIHDISALGIEHLVMNVDFEYDAGFINLREVSFKKTFANDRQYAFTVTVALDLYEIKCVPLYRGISDVRQVKHPDEVLAAVEEMINEKAN